MSIASPVVVSVTVSVTTAYCNSVSDAIANTLEEIDLAKTFETPTTIAYLP